MNKNPSLFIGSHISIRQGYAHAAKTALQIGAKAFQYFPKNPRSLTVKTFDRKDAEACAAFCRTHNILSIAHTPYPVNIAADQPDLVETMYRSLLNDLDIAEACGSVGIVVHFGTYKGKDSLQGYKNILQLLNRITEAWNGNTMLLLENQAGDGVFMGTTMEELTQIRGMANDPSQIGFCFDTCHAYASGLWTEQNRELFMTKGSELGYFNHLKAIHLNDSKYPAQSRKDRHANIGHGFMGEEMFTELLKSSFAHNIPIVLETPVIGGTHENEIKWVHSLAKK
jgi:deoxyribonuclease-4